MWSVFSKINPLSWQAKTIKIAILGFFAFALPAFIIIGLQPAQTDASHYPRLTAETINLDTPVEPLSLTDDQRLVAPATIAGSFSQSAHKTLLIGHSSTVFANLRDLTLGDHLTYADTTYIISDIIELEKSAVNMSELLAPASVDTIVLMTCSGAPLGGQDYTHRLIVTAELTV